MPSLFSRLAHRKKPSISDDNLTSPSSPNAEQVPPSPTRAPASDAQQSQIFDRRNVPDPVGGTEDADHSAFSANRPGDTEMRGAQAEPGAYAFEDRVAAPSSFNQSQVDTTGHARAFADEADRPHLPTTSSNVNNPAPYQGSDDKALPKLPDLPRDVSAPFSLFPLPPGAEAASSTPPAMPHVGSVDRTQLAQTQNERPKPVASESQVIPEDEEGVSQGRFMHVQGSSSATTSRIDPGTKRSLERNMRPERRGYVDANTASNSSRSGTNRPRPQTSDGPRESLRSAYDPDIDGEEHINRHIADLSIRQNEGIEYEPKSSAALEAQREDMATKVLSGTQRGTLNVRGQQTFRAAGMKDKLAMDNTVDVHTQWLEPVVQVWSLRYRMV